MAKRPQKSASSLKSIKAKKTSSSKTSHQATAKNTKKINIAETKKAAQKLLKIKEEELVLPKKWYQKGVFAAIKARTDAYLARRPHRSFRMTRRRDYQRSLILPGNIELTREVQRILFTHKKMFGGLVLIYTVLTMVLVGLGSQSAFNTLSSLLSQSNTSIFSGHFNQVGQAALLLVSSVSGSLTGSLSTNQQIYTVMLALLTWLTTIWLLRNLWAGNKVKLRDGIYSSGAPILATFIVALVFVVQLLPLALGIIGFSAASQTGILTNGIEGLLIAVAIGLLGLLSVYWITATFFGLIIVTIPGMYPFLALKNAGDLVVGRRIRIWLRILWMALCVVVFWAIIMIPLILIVTFLQNVWSVVGSIPIIPFFLVLMSTSSLIWIVTYLYTFYRKVVADDAAPAQF